MLNIILSGNVFQHFYFPSILRIVCILILQFVIYEYKICEIWILKRDDKLNVKRHKGHWYDVVTAWKLSRILFSCRVFPYYAVFFVNPFIALIKPDTVPARNSLRSLETRNCTLGLLPRTTFRVRGLIFSLGFNLVTDCGGVIAQRSTGWVGESEGVGRAEGM